MSNNDMHMRVILLIAGLPVAFLAVALGRWLKGQREGQGVALSVFAATLALGAWSIFRSRASTAAIGFVFLPSYAAIAGVLALGFGLWRSSSKVAARAAAWGCITAALALNLSLLKGGLSSIVKNRVEDATQKAHREEINRNRAAIQSLLAQNKGKEAQALNAQIAARATDRAFLIPALEFPQVSAEWCDRLSSSEDYGIALMAVRHPHCPPATLTRIYRTHRYPDYFFQALAANPNTPPDVLRDLYRRPRTITGLDYWFERNPATPRDILDEIRVAKVKGSGPN